MILLQDCREKKGAHTNIENYCKCNEIYIKRVRLDVGDYMFPNGNISVDVKGGGLEELSSDLYRDKKDFNKKYKKCYKNGIKLIVLVEQKISNMSDILSWKSNHSKINGQFLLEMMNDVKISYGVKFYFCDKKDVGRYLIKLLKEDKGL